MTIWVALFLCTLIPAVVVGIMRDDDGDALVVMCTIVTSFLSAHISWGTPSPILFNATSDLIAAAAIAVLCTERWALSVALLFVLASATSIFAGISTGHTLMYAHALSAVGHAQNIGLIIGGSDDGHTHRRHRVTLAFRDSG